jgi:hypothetical protein
MLNVVISSAIMPDHEEEHSFAECHYTECRSSECRGAVNEEPALPSVFFFF